MFYQIILGSPNLKYVYCEHSNSQYLSWKQSHILPFNEVYYTGLFDLECLQNY